MIYYFSATGNSEFIARELAALTNDQAVSITPFLKNSTMPEPPSSGESVGIVFPVYAFAPPKVVADFAAKLQISHDNYTFGVCTMGGAAGGVFHLLRKKIRLNATFAVAMPSNYIMMSECEPDNRIEKKLTKARKSLPKIAEIINKKRQHHAGRGLAGIILSLIAPKIFNKFVTDKPFHSNTNCTGCGLCAALCPMNDITIEENRPKWHGHCIHCTACIQHCAATAINYGAKTASRKRYIFNIKPNIK